MNVHISDEPSLRRTEFSKQRMMIATLNEHGEGNQQSVHATKVRNNNRINVKTPHTNRIKHGGAGLEAKAELLGGDFHLFKEQKENYGAEDGERPSHRRLSILANLH